MASTKYHVRSISFPSRSHPSTVRVEEHLNKLKTWQTVSSSSESLSNGVSMLEELYGLVDDLLNLGSTQQVLSRNQNDKHLEILLEASVRFLDACGLSRDLLLQTNEHVREVQSAIRRRKGDSSLETCVSSYVCFRKKAKKDVKKLVSTLKQVDKNLLQEQDTTESNDDNGHFYAVIRVLRQVCATTVLLFQSLLSFIVVSESKNKSNTHKWSLLAKFFHKGVIACEDQKLQWVINEFQSVDSDLVTNMDALKTAQRSLEALETRVDGLEKGLETLFRRLIKTRASLLNIISH